MTKDKIKNKIQIEIINIIKTIAIKKERLNKNNWKASKV